MGNQENNAPTVNASVISFVPERGKGKVCEGNADLSVQPEDSIKINGSLEIVVGDCRRDGIMPNEAQIAVIKQNRKRREMLKGHKVQSAER